MQKRLDAPPADLRALDRGRITKAIGVEPRLSPVREEIVFKREAAARAEEAEKLAKANQGADLGKQLKAMADLANIALRAAERSEKAAKAMEAAMAKLNTSTLRKG